MPKVAFTMVALLGACAMLWEKPALADEPGKSEVTSAKIGQRAPNFRLNDLDGKTFELSEILKNKKTTAVVLEWFNPDCPFCQLNYKQGTIKNMVKEFGSQGVRIFGVNSTHYLSAEQIKQKTENWNLNYPVLMDNDGKVGQSYSAKSTPHMFVINKDGILIYEGAIDNQESDDNNVNYVQQALKQNLAGETVSISKTKPYGCPVKYKK